MRRHSVFLVGLLLSILAGCISAPPAEPPDDEAPESLPAADGPEREGVDVPLPDNREGRSSDEEEEPSTTVDIVGATPAAPWVPYETVPAPTRPSAVERRRLAAYANTVALAPVEIRRESIGSSPGQARLVRSLVAGGVNRSGGDGVPDPVARREGGYRLATVVIGEMQPSEQNFYGRARIDRSVVDGVTGEVIARSDRSGPWTFSRVSVEDAQLNSLRRLVEGGDGSDAVRRRFAGAMMRGVVYRVRFSAALPKADSATITSALRVVAFSIEPNDGGLFLRSFAPPDHLEARVNELFAGSPYEIGIDSMTRHIVIGYTQD